MQTANVTMESGRYMFLIYKTYISDITFMSQDAIKLPH